MIVQTGKGKPDGIVGIDRDFCAHGASQRLFAKSRPVYVVPPKRTGLHFIECAIQVCCRSDFVGSLAVDWGAQFAETKKHVPTKYDWAIDVFQHRLSMDWHNPDVERTNKSSAAKEQFMWLILI